MSKSIHTDFQLFQEWYLNEKAISDENLIKHESILKNIGDYKSNSKELQNFILQLKQSILDSNIKFEKFEEESNKKYTKVKYSQKIKHKIDNILEILETSEGMDVYDKYYSIIYPDGNEIDFEPDIDIEENLFNRVHVPDGLPFILKGIGLGKKIYLSLIDELGYLSTTKRDQSIDAVFVWDSLRKEKSVYTFIKDSQVLCVSEKMDFKKIKELLDKYYQHFDIMILDDDFSEKYDVSWLYQKKP